MYVRFCRFVAVHAAAVASERPAAPGQCARKTALTDHLDELLDGYPEGTVTVDPRPGEDYEMVKGRWVEVTPQPIPEPTPEELRAAMRPLTPREFRDALIDNEIMPDQVTAAINQIADDKERAKALNAWEYPTQFTRTDPLVDQIGTIFGLTPEKIDKLWTEASA